MKTLNNFSSIITLCFFTIQWGGVNAQLYPEPYIVDSLEDLRMIIYPITICDDLLHPVDPPSYGAPIPSFCTSTYCERNYKPTITILYDVSSSSPISADYKIEYRVHNLMPSFTTIKTGTVSMSDCFKPWLFGTCNASYTVTDSLIDIYGTGMYKITVFDNQTSNTVTHTQYYVSPKYDTKFGLSPTFITYNNPNFLGGNLSQYNTPSLTPYSFCNGNIKIYLHDEVLPNDNYTYCFDTVDQEYDCGPPLQLVVYSANSSGDIVSGYEDTITYQELFNSNTNLTYFNLNDLSNNRFVTHPGYYLIKSEYTGEGDFYLGDTLCGEYMADSWKFIRALPSNALDTKFETNGDLSSYDTLGSLNTYCDDIDRVEFSSSLITYATNNQNILTNNDLQVEVFTTDSTGNTATGTSVYQSNITVTEMINGEHIFSVLPKNKYYVFKVSGASTACAANSESFLFVRNLAEDSLKTVFSVDGNLSSSSIDTPAVLVCADSINSISFPQATLDFYDNNSSLIADGDLKIKIYNTDSTGNINTGTLVLDNDITKADLDSGVYYFPNLVENEYYVFKVYNDTYCFVDTSSYLFVRFLNLDYTVVIFVPQSGSSQSGVNLDISNNNSSINNPITLCGQTPTFSFDANNQNTQFDAFSVSIDRYNLDGSLDATVVDDVPITLPSGLQTGVSTSLNTFFPGWGNPNSFANPANSLKVHKITLSYSNVCGFKDFEYWIQTDVSCKTDFATINNQEENNIETKNFIEAIYPNPASTVLNIEFTNNEVENEIKIIDITGKIVLTIVINNEDINKKATIDISNLTKGIYFVNFNTTYGIKTEKIIIQ